MDKKDTRNLYHALNERGELVTFDLVTGEEVREPSIEEHLLAEGGTNVPARLRFGVHSKYVYNPVVKDVIAGLVAEGKSFKHICAMDGMPSIGVLARWRAEHPDLNSAINMAKRMRAEIFADSVMEDAHELRALEKDMVPAERLFLEKVKWLTAVNSPDDYGNRTKLTGDKDAPIQWVITTGIDSGGEAVVLPGKEEAIELQGETDGTTDTREST